MATSAVFWLSLPLVMVAGLSVDFSWKFANRLFFPKAWHILQEKVKTLSKRANSCKYADSDSSKGEPDEHSPLLPKHEKKQFVNIEHSTGV
jgi:hypothetical protein